MIRGVRGAVTVPENEPGVIRSAVQQLVETLLERNKIWADDIVAVFFTVTPDITTLNPAKAIRDVRTDWQGVPMLCSQEPVIEGMLPYCIRILIQWKTAEKSTPVYAAYLGEAKHLRPDL